MKIMLLRIANFRCFGDINDDGVWPIEFRPNSGLNLLIGSNSSGKTALIDAINIVLNPENRFNYNLISEFDFSWRNTKKKIQIEIVLSDIGPSIQKFPADIQWFNQDSWEAIDIENIEPNQNNHNEGILIRFEAYEDPIKGDIEWKWILPKFKPTEIEEKKELTKAQHESIGFFKIEPQIAKGAFTLGEYSALGRHLRRLNYKMGKLPLKIRPKNLTTECDISNLNCDECEHRLDCIREIEEGEQLTYEKTIGQKLSEITTRAVEVLGTFVQQDMAPGLGPRFGGFQTSLAALTVGYKQKKMGIENAGFIPFERLSAGEQYALSYALATTSMPGEKPPIIVTEEPETALYPSAIAKIIDEIQRQPSGKEPQIIMTSHSESVLRRFASEDIFLISPERKIINFKNSLRTSCPSTGLSHYELEWESKIMPGEASALFTEKILVVEGANENITSGYLDRLSEKKFLAALGYSIISCGGTGNIDKYAKILSGLDKKVSILLDGDEAGKDKAEELKNGYPIFIYEECDIEKDPTLEDALLLGLPNNKQDNALDEFYSHPTCETCSLNERSNKCWKIKCVREKGRPRHKEDLQRICLETYRKEKLFPPAFFRLAKEINLHKIGIKKLQIKA